MVSEDDDDDRLTFLPLDLRSKILSHLPTEDAIRTSVLSTQWKNVCSTLQTLTFHQVEFHLNHRTKHPILVQADFIDYVTQTLSHHDKTSSINSFNLSLVLLDPDDDTFLSHPITTVWVAFVSAHNAHRITLSFANGPDLGAAKLPLSLLKSNPSLLTLDLHNITLTLPPARRHLRFPNLRTLALLHVEFVDGNATNQLLECCMALEVLVIQICSWKSAFTRLRIPSPRLRSLVLQGSHPFTDIQPCSANLRKLDYLGYAPLFDTKHFSSLTDASFIIPPNITGPRVSNLLKGLKNVINLFLGGFFLELLVKEGDLLLSQWPTCSSLKHLSLNLYPTGNQVRIAKLIMGRYPNLETLYISVKGNGMDLKTLITGKLCENKELQTDCLRQLKIVEIGGCGESEIELDLIRYLLENGPSLRTMEIFLEQYKSRKYSTVSEKIDNLAAAFPCVTVSVFSRDSVFGMRRAISSHMFRKWDARPFWNVAS